MNSWTGTTWPHYSLSMRLVMVECFLSHGSSFCRLTLYKFSPSPILKLFLSFTFNPTKKGWFRPMNSQSCRNAAERRRNFWVENWVLCTVCLIYSIHFSKDNSILCRCTGLSDIVMFATFEFSQVISHATGQFNNLIPIVAIHWTQHAKAARLLA